MLSSKLSCFSLSDMDLNDNFTDVLGDIESLDPSEQLQALEKDYKRLAEDHKRILGEWYKDCELLHAEVADLHNINRELEQKLLKAKEVLQHIEELTRHSVTVVGSPLREAIINCLDSICQKVDK